MSTAVAPIAPSLYELEQDLQSFLDTEDLVSPEQEQVFRAELASAIQASVEKRDRVGQFIRHCELQARNCDEEIKRLQSRKRTFDNAEKRVRGYVQSVIESLALATNGKTQKLEGKIVTFSLRAKPPSVEITDESAIPVEYKHITFTVSKTLVKEALEQGTDVPGADLSIGGYCLVVK